MIAVAEPPLEFIPRGRQAAEDHPGPSEPPLPKYHHLPAEHLLLQRLQNVNISSAAASAINSSSSGVAAAEEQQTQQEFWCIREIYDDYESSYARTHRRQQLIELTKKCGPNAAAATQLTSLPTELLQPLPRQRREEPMCDSIVNNEEELYVHKHTVVWTQGLNDANDDDGGGVHRRMCFTSDTPVKFACFLNPRFVRGRLAQLRAAMVSDDDKLTAICVVDQDALRVYCDDGEDFVANLDFPISHLWQTVHGLLLEKDSSNALVSHLSIPMPRLFSMSHPLHEACPVVLKTSTNSTGYMTEPEYSVVFTTEDSDLVLLYDAKFFKHFVARLRKVTPEEVNYVSQQQQQDLLMHQTLQGNRANPGSSTIHSFSSTRNTGATPKLNTTSFAMPQTHNVSKFGMSQSQSFSGVLGQSNRASLGTPLSHLQNSIDQHSLSIKDMRKITHVKPAKPIEPEMCLEHIWTENTYGTQREFCEMASRAFIHTDLVGQTYLCYLLARSCRLQMVLLNGYDTSELQLSTLASTLPAKDAVGLQRLHMIAVLDPGGNLILYTGTVLISKVHITPLLSAPSTSTTTAPTATATPTPLVVPSVATTSQPHTPLPLQQLKVASSSSFVEVRRSSLLPTKAAADLSGFDDELELHMLSPIQPQPVSYSQRQAHNICKALRDPAGNRLTLVYATGRMLRIALPLLNDTRLITRCVAALRQVLNPTQFLHFVIRWYSARNPPGSRDYSIEQEWQLFRSTLLGLMGCMAASSEQPVDVDESYARCATPPFQRPTMCSSTAAQDEPKKRRKYNDCESYTDDDWEFLLMHTTLAPCGGDGSQAYSVDVTAPLFRTLPAVFYGLHLLYEDLKLDSVFNSGLIYLGTFLHQLAIDMQLDSYIFHYQLDFPELTHKTTKLTLLSSEHGALMLYQELLRMPAPSIYAQLEHVVLGREEVAPYNYVECINERSRNVVQLVSLVMHGHEKLKHWWQLLEVYGAVQLNYPKRGKRSINATVPRCHQLLELLLCMQLTRRDIERLPAAVHLIVAEALELARIAPPMGCSLATYELILRPELAAHAQLPFLEATLGQPQCGRVYKEDSLSPRCAPASGESPMAEPDAEQMRHDGMDNMDTKLLRLRFPDDMRVEEVRRLLNSADPVAIEVQQSPGTSDHEFIEEQEKQLFALCARTMTLPLGRGMFTLRTLMPRPSDSMPMPKLCLVGKEPIKGTTIEMQQIEFPANMHMWPSFHNGVATGLKISPQALDIDSTWIVYNKPKTQANNALEHAGFLMALGLNGHLKSLSFMSVYKYLVKCDEMTSVGLLLGISAAHRGSMDTKTTKLLSVHLEALLPATAMELDIPQSTQVAALMGIGLLYQGSAKRHIAEVLLQEIGRPPGPEMENSVERESYAMTAGLALGLVTLGQGEAPPGLRDLQLPDTLHYYMVGGVKRPIGGSQKEKYRLASFQVREGDNVNIDVTAPGATLALGLMFFDSGNAAIAEWMQPPDSRYLLDMVRPDFLLLRTIARGLILWQDVQPTNEWFQAQFPQTLRTHLRLPSRDDEQPDDNDVDYEAITQAYCNILAGAAFCIGLKYAGTENPVAFTTLRTVIKEFLGFPGTPMGECAGRTTIESCLMVLLISISLVFAGSGNCEILRIIRYLRSRVGPQYPHITYGSHMAIHMSLGLLFLGAGRFTIAKTPESIAALVCAFFPKFPIHSNDNRYHLQALRHLYVLAVEPRLFLPRDIDTNQLCLCNISVLEVGANELRRLPIAPCILPELSTLQKVVVDDENYWPVCFERTRNWHQLEKALELCAPIDIKKRTGRLSHLEDPDRLKSMLAQTLTTEQSICWQVDVNDLQQFASERLVKPFLSRFLDTKGTTLSVEEQTKRHHLMLLFYNAVVKDRMHLLPVYLTLYDHVTRQMANNNDVWQVKLIDAYLGKSPNESHSLISVELIQMMQELFKIQLEASTRELCVPLREFLCQKRLEPSYVACINAHDLQRVYCVINYYNLLPDLLNGVDMSNGPINYLRIMYEFQQLNLSPHTIFGLLKIFQSLRCAFNLE